MAAINTNTDQLSAKTHLFRANEKMPTTRKCLPAGLRITHTLNDVTCLDVGHKMATLMKSKEVTVRNNSDNISISSKAENFLSKILETQLQISWFAVQSANRAHTDQDTDMIESESKGLIREVGQLVAHTKFNGISVLDGSFQGKVVQTILFGVTCIAVLTVAPPTIFRQTAKRDHLLKKIRPALVLMLPNLVDQHG